MKTLLKGLFIVGVLGVVGVGVFFPQVMDLISNTTRTDTQAKGESIPREVSVVSSGENEFIVSWITNKKVVGGIKYGRLVEDLRLAAAELEPSRAKNEHLVRVTGLSSGVYYIQVISGGLVFGNDDEPWKVTIGSL